MKCRAHVELHTGELEQVEPDVPSEYGITIGDNGRRKSMEVEDFVEECSSDACCGVWVTQWNEVSILGQAVNHGEDDAFAVNLGKAFHEIE